MKSHPGLFSICKAPPLDILLPESEVHIFFTIHSNREFECSKILFSSRMRAGGWKLQEKAAETLQPSPLSDSYNISALAAVRMLPSKSLAGWWCLPDLKRHYRALEFIMLGRGARPVPDVKPEISEHRRIKSNTTQKTFAV